MISRSSDASIWASARERRMWAHLHSNGSGQDGDSFGSKTAPHLLALHRWRCDGIGNSPCQSVLAVWQHPARTAHLEPKWMRIRWNDFTVWTLKQPCTCFWALSLCQTRWCACHQHSDFRKNTCAQLQNFFQFDMQFPKCRQNPYPSSKGCVAISASAKGNLHPRCSQVHLTDVKPLSIKLLLDLDPAILPQHHTMRAANIWSSCFLSPYL